ncbi:MAG: pyruvoyl-dependent arginine decarboxylase [Prevotellaceae bacterium]|jgi:arginine decarboxylase|nr:pyruvoyl-dependent arginine decarboxylase [Prevotellaceae bacterium]
MKRQTINPVAVATEQDLAAVSGQLAPVGGTPLKSNMLKGIIVGCRIPQDYFETQGKGESDIAVHAGSYHLALKDANIEKYNIMTYSSILPGIANLIPQPAQMVHGCVVESIMSTCTVGRGERGTAGIVYGWLYHRTTGERYGGLVCENYGDFSPEALEALLRSSLNELYVNGFEEDYRLDDIKYLNETIVPQKKHGTALVALCFTSYFYPVIA